MKKDVYSVFVKSLETHDFDGKNYFSVEPLPSGKILFFTDGNAPLSTASQRTSMPNGTQTPRTPRSVPMSTSEVPPQQQVAVDLIRPTGDRQSARRQSDIVRAMS